MNPTLFNWMGKRVWCNSIALFVLPEVLPDPQILGMLIGVDGLERLVILAASARSVGEYIVIKINLFKRKG